MSRNSGIAEKELPLLQNQIKLMKEEKKKKETTNIEANFHK